MHILYLHQYFVPPDGSGGTRSYEMARRMVKAGHRVTLVTSSAYFPAHYDIRDGVTVKNLDGVELRILKVPYSNRLPFHKRILAFLDFSWKAGVESLRSREVDVIYASSTPLTIALPAIAAKLWHRKPMVFEVRDLWPEVPIAMGFLNNPVLRWLAVALERLAYRNSARIVTLSPGMSEGVARSGYPIERVATVPNSCDIELFRVPESRGLAFREKLGIAPRRPIVIYTGTIGKVNGVEYFARMAAEMRKLDPEVLFLVVGDGNCREELLRVAGELGVLGANFLVMPPTLKSEMPAALSAATVCCSFVIDVPALWHNSANKFFDTLAAGRPMLINHEGWQADILRSSGAGLVVPAGDPAAAAGALHDFLKDERRMSQAREASSRLADRDYNRDLLFEKLLTVLESAGGRDAKSADSADRVPA